MKQLVFIVVFFSVTNAIFSQNFNRFLPLKLGNRWVYDCIGADYTGYSHDRVTITINGITNYSGKEYFNYSQTVVHIEGNVMFNPGMFLFRGGPIRIDSISGNIYYLMQGQGCSYSPDEIMTDSLNVNLYDTVKINCSSNNYFYRCTDTSSGHRSFDNDYWGSRKNRQYTDGVGFNYSLYLIHISTTPTYTQNLVGGVINGVAFGDTNTLVGINSTTHFIPKNFSVYQNYPNPFNPSTKIKFDISKASYVEMKIFDVLGNEVADLVHEQLKPGSYEVEWDGSNYSSGIYFYKLMSGDFVETKKMVLMK